MIDSWYAKRPVRQVKILNLFSIYWWLYCEPWTEAVTTFRLSEYCSKTVGTEGVNIKIKLVLVSILLSLWQNLFWQVGAAHLKEICVWEAENRMIKGLSTSMWRGINKLYTPSFHFFHLSHISLLVPLFPSIPPFLFIFFIVLIHAVPFQKCRF